MADKPSPSQEPPKAAAEEQAKAEQAKAEEPKKAEPVQQETKEPAKSTSIRSGMEELTPNPDQDNPAADWRNMRRIIAEDPEWSLAVVPPLSELALRHIVENFANNSHVLYDLSPKDKAIVLERIPTSLPLKITGTLIDDEGYWERCCRARWEVCDISVHGDSWKQLFCERNLQEIIELFVPGTTDPTELAQTLSITAKFIKKLEIRQLLPPVAEPQKQAINLDESSDEDSDEEDQVESDHFNFGPVLEVLTNLEEFHLTYGVRDCGMNFEWSIFLFTERDCLQLAKNVAEKKSLKLFRLHRSKVDDEKLRVFIAHIVDHPTLEVLDLSNNIIGDRGARAVCKFINNHSQLVRLILTDNKISATGAQALAHGLIKNDLLKHLDLRLNHLGDEGAQAIFRALLKNITLIEINLSSNEITELSASVLCDMLLKNSTLKSLDLSCNRLGPDCGKLLQDSMEVNTSLTDMDLRLTECGQKAEYSINLSLHRNREADRDAAIKRREANAPPQRKEADPQAAHRFKIPPDFFM